VLICVLIGGAILFDTHQEPHRGNTGVMWKNCSSECISFCMVLICFDYID